MSWPARPKLYQDELLSSWMTRLARANGLSLPDFWRIVNPDHSLRFVSVDRRASQTLLDVLASETGTSAERLKQALMISDEYFGQTFHRHRGWTRELRYCSSCFRDDREPYYRRAWQSLSAFLCPEHATWLRNRCPNCRASLRVETLPLEAPTMATCGQCGEALGRTAEPTPPPPSAERIRFLVLQERMLRLTDLNMGSESQLARRPG
jgi:hypothetical protein